MSVVFWKELADHFSSRRFMILLIIIILSGFWATYATGQAIRQNTDTVPVQYVFLLSAHIERRDAVLTGDVSWVFRTLGRNYAGV